MIKRIILLLTAFAILFSMTACTLGTTDDPKTTSSDAVDTTGEITLDVGKTINNKFQSFSLLLQAGDYKKAKEDYEYIVGKNKNGKYDEVITLMNGFLMEEYSTLKESMLSASLSQDTTDKLNDFKVFSSYTGSIIKQVTDQTVQDYLEGKLSYEDTLHYLNHSKTVAPDLEERDDYIARLPQINASKQIYDNALEQVENEQLSEAIITLKTIGQDQYYYRFAQEKIQELNQKILSGRIDEIKTLMSSYDYNKAVSKVDEYLVSYPDNATLLELKQTSQKNLSELYEYTGPLYHIFFHSLIVYNKKAFDGDFMEQGYNYWMTTTEECQKILEQLYERNYVLYDIRKLITTNPDGTVSKNKIMVPKGKKPIILSIDDVSYYDYMKTDGFATRLIIDENGKVANLTIAPDGSEVISRDHDVMPMVDKFVEEHPDFSYQGAKGIMALTGYEGVLGYRTNNPDEKNKEEIQALTAQAKEVADAMKANGWLFSSHSYTHADTFSDGVFGLDFLKTDNQRWKKEVSPIIGDTNIYITPFGYQLKPGSESYNYLVSEGFNILCAVGGMPYVSYDAKAVRMDRQNLDGFMMTYNKNLVKDLIDPDYTIDKSRPAFPKNPW
ncbi:MAG TPA: hypothetical protein DDZ89_02775 [Clostridiales bacterium]|nr:hypothetical protein [Clostridiales bacterium]